MKLVVGLGNPGKDYEITRHNVGFIILDNYVKNATWSKEKEYLFYITNVDNEKVIFIKPQTFMNLSGYAVAKAANYYKIKPEDILVIHDDLDLNIGICRLKSKSSSGGHNGVKSIIEQLGTDNFSRLKIGIGKDCTRDTKNYVLSKLSKDEISSLHNEKYLKIIDSFVINGIERTMNIYNTKEV